MMDNKSNMWHIHSKRVSSFFFKQKTAYEMRISDWSSDVCSSDLSGMRKWLTEKPHRPALGLPPRPVAPSSRISPPDPVAAPGNGAIAVGWLWVSTLIANADAQAGSWRNSQVDPGLKRLASWPSITAALSL